MEELVEQPEEKTLLYRKKDDTRIESSSNYSEVEESMTRSNAYKVALIDSAEMDVEPIMEDLKTKIDSLLERTNEGDFRWKCTVCGKKTKHRTDIRRHIETHIDGVSHTCNQCGKVSRSSNALVMHISTYHRKKRKKI